MHSQASLEFILDSGSLASSGSSAGSDGTFSSVNSSPRAEMTSTRQDVTSHVVLTPIRSLFPELLQSCARPVRAHTYPPPLHCNLSTLLMNSTPSLCQRPLSYITSSSPPSTATNIAEQHTDKYAANITESKEMAAVPLRNRRKFHEVERLYCCQHPGCGKSYGALNHLNTHIVAKNHGQKRDPTEFQALRKFLRDRELVHRLALSANSPSSAAVASHLFYPFPQSFHPYHR